MYFLMLKFVLVTEPMEMCLVYWMLMVMSVSYTHLDVYKRQLRNTYVRQSQNNALL